MWPGGGILHDEEEPGILLSLVSGRQSYQERKQFPFSRLTNEEPHEVISTPHGFSVEENIEPVNCT